MIGCIADVLIAGRTDLMHTAVTGVVTASQRTMISALTEIFTANAALKMVATLAGTVSAFKQGVIALAQEPAAYTAYVVRFAVTDASSACGARSVHSAMAYILSTHCALLVVSVFTGVMSAGEELVHAKTNVVSAVLIVVITDRQTSSAYRTIILGIVITDNFSEVCGYYPRVVN